MTHAPGPDPAPHPLPDPEFSLLFVCTGNICRSSMAEVLAADELGRRLGRHAPRFFVGSAGTHGLQDHPIDHSAAAALARHGRHGHGFRARVLTQPLVEQADLILTATRRHRAAAVTMVPRASARTFTILEFARLVPLVDAESLPDGADPVAHARAMVIAAAAQRGRVWVEPHLDDIDDPYGLGSEDFRECHDIIEAAVRTIAEALCG
jgi:protein-tyrosine phosphatase